MATFPRYTRRIGVGGGPTASYASDSAFSAPGRALQGFGDAIAYAGGQIGDKLEKTKNSMDDTWFSRARAETAMSVQKFEHERELSTTDGASYQEAVLDHFEQQRNQYLAEAPSDRARQMYDEWSFSYLEKVNGATSQFRAATDLAQRSDSFTKAFLAHTQTIFEDPTQFDAVKKRFEDDMIAASKWMTPEQELAVREKAQNEFDLARAKANILRDPAAFKKEVGLGGTETVTIKGIKPAADVDGRAKQAMTYFMGEGLSQVQAAGIVGNLLAESNLVTHIKGDKGTAFGIAQWRESRFAALKRYAAANRADWRDFGIQLSFVMHEMKTNYPTVWAKLQNATTVDEATAAFIGYERPKGYTDLNPRAGHNYKGRLAFAANYAGGDVTAELPVENPDFSKYPNLTIDELMGLNQEADRRILQAERDQQAALAAEYSRIKGALATGIRLHDPSITEASIINSGLPQSEQHPLINMLHSERGDDYKGRLALSELAGGKRFDALNSDHQKSLDLAYKYAAGDDSLFTPEGKARPYLEWSYDKSGYIPDAAMAEIRGGLLSNDPARVATAASIAASLAGNRKHSLGSLAALPGGGEDIARAAQDYIFGSRRGLTGDDLGNYLMKLRDPEEKARRESFRNSDWFKKQIDGIDSSDVKAVFQGRLMRTIAALDPTGAVKDVKFPTRESEAVLTDMYKRIYGDNVIYYGGDENGEATEAAQRDFLRTVGLVDTPGGMMIQLNAPSALFPADKAGSQDWIREQAIEALMSKGIEATDVMFMPDTETEADMRAGDMPTYQIYYESEGSWKFYPQRYTPDATTRDKYETQREADRFDASAAERQRFLESKDMQEKAFERARKSVEGMDNVSPTVKALELDAAIKRETDKMLQEMEAKDRAKQEAEPTTVGPAHVFKKGEFWYVMPSSMPLEEAMRMAESRPIDPETGEPYPRFAGREFAIRYAKRHWAEPTDFMSPMDLSP